MSEFDAARRPPPAPRLAGPQARTPEHDVLIEEPWFHELRERMLARGLALRWVVVDDLEERSCELAIGPWPRLADDGRLVFASAEEDYTVAAVPIADFEALVRAGRRRQLRDVPDTDDLVDRPLRVGDTFAAAVEVATEGTAPEGGHRAAISFPAGADGIADVTAHARVFAKVQVAVAEAAPIDTRLIPDLREQG